MNTIRRSLALVACWALVAGCGTTTSEHRPAASPTPSTSAGRPSLPASTASASPSTSPSPSPSPTATPFPTAPEQTAPDLARYGWFSFNAITEGWGIEGPANPTGDTLIHVRAGTLAGHVTLSVDLRRKAPDPPIVGGAMPFGEGPFGRYAIYGYTDPAGSQLHRLDILTGRDTTILRDARVIHRAVFDAAAKAYYLALLDGAARTDLGIWRYRPGIDAAPTLLERPTGLKDAGAGPDRRLFLTPSGTALVVVDCSLPANVPIFDCLARSIDTATGGLLQNLGEVSESLVGVTDRWFVDRDRAFALDGSRVLDLPGTCGAPTLTSVAGDDVVVLESSGPGCGRSYYEITALDLDTGGKRVIWSKRDFRTTYDPALVPLEEHPMPPAGYVLLAPMNIPDPPDSVPGLLLSVADGTAIPLPPWP